MIVKPNSCTGLVLIVDVMKVPCTLTNHNDIDLPFPYNLVVVVAIGYSFFKLLLRSQTFLLVDGGLLGTAGWNSNGKDKVPDVQSVQKVSEMRTLLDGFVKLELFRGETGPIAMHRHFYPSDRELKSYIAHFRNTTWDPIIDQLNLENLVETWNMEQPYDSSCFRPRKTVAQKGEPQLKA